MGSLQKHPRRSLRTKLGDSIESFRKKIQELRPLFVVITLFLLFSAPFVNSLAFKLVAIFAFLTNLLFLIFDLKVSLFAKVDEIKSSVEAIRITILNCNPLAFQSSINPIPDFSVTLPILIGTSIEGCLSPTYRDSIDLTRLYKVRAYCDFLKTEKGKEYPPILVCTGRSQGYVELLAQVLGLAEGCVEIPFIIEMGTALYYPISKRTETLVHDDEVVLIRNIESIIRQDQELKNIIFEPKSFIITVNPADAATVEELFQKVAALLIRQGLGDKVNIISGNTAVDIIPKRINRLAILEQVVSEFSEKYIGRRQGLESVVYIVESNGDKAVIDYVREAYCSEIEATHDIERKVKQKFGASYSLKQKDIDVFLTVLEKTCGIKIL
jgi:hypothetical protein